MGIYNVSSVLSTSHVVYYAGKPIENYILLFKCYMVISNCKGIVYINMISDDNLVKNVFVNMILLDIQYKMFRNMS